MKPRLRAWLDQTHGEGFELMRHFLAHFFDSEMTATPGEWLKVAIGLVAVLLSFGILAIQTYMQRYGHLHDPSQSTPQRYLSAVRSDELSFIVLAMAITALLTAVQWQSLFPTLRDSLALAGLPVSPRQIFVAKFGALLLMFTAFLLALNVPPAVLFTAVMAGPWQQNPSGLITFAANFAATGGVCVFVFFSLLAVQGVLLNVLPGRLFTRASMAVQAAVFIATLGTLPLLGQQPEQALWWPPVWFVNLRSAILGAPSVSPRTALLALALPPVIAVLSYLLSYHRYRRLLLEAPISRHRRRWEGFGSWLLDRWIRDPREQSAFAFLWKTLTRSRDHRLVLMAYAGFALGWVLKGAADMPQSSRNDVGTLGVFVALAPLTASICVVLAMRYLFSLPVELRANWIFQITEQEGRAPWLRAMERFVIWLGIAPIFAATLPAAIAVFGWARAAAESVMGFLLAVLIFEALFRRWQKLPFTCTYLPGKQPIWLSLVRYGLSIPLLAAAGQLLIFSSGDPVAFLAVLVFEVAAIWRMRHLRRQSATVTGLRYQDTLDDGLMTLDLQRGDDSELQSGSPGPRPAAPLFSESLVASRGMLPLDWREELDDHRRQSAFFPTLFEDVRYGLRLVRRNWLLSTVVVLTLTLGIGMNVSVMTVINGLALQPHVYKDPDSFVRVIPQPRFQNSSRPVSYSEYVALRDRSRTLRDLAAFDMFGAQIDEDPTITFGLMVTCNFFTVDGVDRAIVGRLLVPGDCQSAGQAPVAIIGESLWKSRFASDPNIVGRVIHLNGRPVTLIGVVPNRTSGWTRPSRIWLPYTATLSGRNLFGNDDYFWLELAGRLAPGVSRDQARAELAILIRQQDQLHPGRRTDITVTDGSWIDEVNLNSRNLMAMGWIIGALNLVLLISCANVTTLLLSRAAARKREIAVRLSLGAPRVRLVRMLITESLILAVLAGAASLYLAWHVPGPLFQYVADRRADFPLPPDWRIIAYIAAVVFGAGCVAGLAPALESLKVDLAAGLKGHAGVFGGAVGRSRLHGLLVASQVALSLVLLVGAGLFAQAEYHILEADPGYQPRKLVVAPIRFPDGSTAASAHTTVRAIAARLTALPGVRTVAWSEEPPLLSHDTVEVKRPGRSSDLIQTVDVYPASSSYFEALGLPIVRGRGFQDSDRSGVVISQALAKILWPRGDPIGERLRLPEGPVTVLGIARDVNPLRFGGSENPAAYRLTPLNPQHTFLLVRFDRATPAAVSAVRAAIRNVNPEMVGMVRVLQEWIDEVTSILWNVVSLVVTLGFVAIMLATTGIYGAVAFAVNQRTRDMGIRVALGAQRFDIVREVFVTGGKPVLKGIFVGLWMSLVTATGLKQTFKQTTIQLDSADPIVYCGAALLLIFAALLAMTAPARRAAASDPLDSLRSE